MSRSAPASAHAPDPPDDDDARADLHTWQAERSVSLAEARKEAARMRMARRGFILLAAVSGGSVLVFALAHSLSQGFIRTPMIRTEDSIQLIEPRFIGRDDSGAEFVILADKAERAPDEDAPVALTNPRFENNRKQTIEAPAGVYDSANQRLELSGGFVFLDEDYRFTGPTAQIATDTGVVSGAEGVRGEGPLGKVRAEAYEFHSRDGRVFLRGDVRGELQSRNAKGADSP